MNKFFDLNKTYHYIVDTSYIVFCCASSAFKDYVYQEDIQKSQMGPNFDPTQDPEFNYIFEKKFISKIETPIKQIAPFFFDKSKFVFSLDCARKDIWRREFYPEYKLNRDGKDSSKDLFNIGAAFSYAYSNIIPNYCSSSGAKIIRSTCAESDDVIAVLTKYLLDKDEHNHIIILSSDRDMVQLYNDRVSIITAQNELREPKKELMSLTGIHDIEENITADDFLLFKIIIGDGSDNIPSIKYRLGPKKAVKYVLNKDHSELKSLLSEDIDIAKAFNRNKQLISMKEIPQNVKDLIIENIEEEFSKNIDIKSEPTIKKEDDIDELLKDIL